VLAVLGAVLLIPLLAVTGLPSHTPRSKRPALHPCVAAGGGSALCGTVTVPLEREDLQAGTTTIAFALYRQPGSSRSRGLVVALDGGPGYASAFPGSFAVGPLVQKLLHHSFDVVLVDQRGTGGSGAISCKALQDAAQVPYTPGQMRPWYAACAKTLGSGVLRYRTAAAADDIDAVRASLGATKLDVYGVSYGTVLAETYALRHPDRVRSLVLDSPYPLYGNLFGQDLAHAFLASLNTTCARDPGCHTRIGDPVHLLGRLLTKLRKAPVHATVPIADSPPQTVTVGPSQIAELALAAGDIDPHVYRELPAAAASALRDDPQPLLRLWANYLNDDAGNDSTQIYSAGQDAAVTCPDYPQPFNVSASPAVRRTQYDHAVAALSAGSFGIFSTQEWLDATSLTGPAGCTEWPSQHTADPPLPPHPHYPNVPTLILAGELDTSTSSAGARQVARQFPSAQLVTVTDASHDLLEDDPDCGPQLIAAFIETHRAPRLTCTTSGRANLRLIDSFPTTAAGLTPASPLSGDRSTPAGRQLVTAAIAVVGEALWYDDGTHNPVLRGGFFDSTTTGPITHISFHAARFVTNAAVNGTLTITQQYGDARLVSAKLRVQGPRGVTGTLHVHYTDHADQRNLQITIAGNLNGKAIHEREPAP